MKSHVAPALLALLATTALADVLRIPVSRNSPGTVTTRNPHLSKRAFFAESLVNNITGGGYYASVSVGTPGQDIDMVLDTGSSDAFIIANDADLCESPRLQLQDQTSCGQTCELFYHLTPLCQRFVKDSRHTCFQWSELHEGVHWSSTIFDAWQKDSMWIHLDGQPLNGSVTVQL